MRTSVQPIDRQTAASSLGGSRLGGGTSFGALAAGVAITLYAAWNARNLIGAWLHSPFDRCDSLAFALWIVPIAVLWMPRHGAHYVKQVSVALFAGGLVVSFAGIATDLGVLKYVGLAIALAGFLPVRGSMYFWLGCSAAWMPAAGWAFSSHGPIAVNMARIAVGIAAASLTPLFVRHESLR